MDRSRGKMRLKSLRSKFEFSIKNIDNNVQKSSNYQKPSISDEIINVDNYDIDLDVDIDMTNEKSNEKSIEISLNESIHTSINQNVEKSIDDKIIVLKNHMNNKLDRIMQIIQSKNDQIGAQNGAKIPTTSPNNIALKSTYAKLFQNTTPGVNAWKTVENAKTAKINRKIVQDEKNQNARSNA